jgi:hypothetical protein
VAIIINPKRWLRQPPLGSTINFGHPLAIGLRYYILYNAGTGAPRALLPFNLSSTLIDSLASPPWKSGADGRSLNWNNAFGYGVVRGAFCEPNWVSVVHRARRVGTLAQYAAAICKTFGDANTNPFASYVVYNNPANAGQDVLQARFGGAGSFHDGTQFTAPTGALGLVHTTGMSVGPSGSSAISKLYFNGIQRESNTFASISGISYDTSSAGNLLLGDTQSTAGGETSDVHNVDSDVQVDSSDVHNIDSDVQKDSSDTHNLDSDVQTSSSDVHNIDSDIRVDSSDVHNIDLNVASPLIGNSIHNLDADVMGSPSPSHNLDADVQETGSYSHSLDCEISNDKSGSHNLDCFVTGLHSNSHNLDADVAGGFFTDDSHSLDAFIVGGAYGFVQEAVQLIPPITNPNAFIKEAATLGQPAIGFINQAVLLQSKPLDFLAEEVLLVSQKRSYLKEAVQLSKGGQTSHNLDADISLPILSLLKEDVLLVQNLQATGCDGSYPDVSYLKCQVWLVAPGNNSKQAPGSGLTLAEDWASQTDALAAYQPIARFVLAGIPMVITGFTSGTISWQTKTRQWLRLVDYEPGGVVVSKNSKTQKLANGQTIQTETVVTQIQDTTITTVTITDSTNPNRVSKIITERNQGGQTTTREVDIFTINGVRTTTEKKNVNATAAPSKENIQPIKVTTLDGVIHYQFFGNSNTPAWAGGEAEGTSNSTKMVTTSGNTRHTQETVSTPDGKVINTITDETGLRDIGQTTTDTDEQFNGIQKTTVKTVTYPDGSQEVTTTVTNLTTGETTETIVETSTDENGQQTTTTTQTTTQTFQDPVTSNLRTTITKTVTVAGPTGTYTDTTTEFRDNFEDDLIQQKIKVYLIQEFTINCVIDRFSKEALEEIAIGHQKNFAVAELIGQQLGNMDLSWLLRNNLIGQFYEAINCISPIEFQALGKTYMVVFAPSASSFRAKYVVGTMPAIYELQMIVQERSDLVTGLAGF